MKLQIPKEQAIARLEKRILEINSYEFEPEVWKGATEEDLQYIFGALDLKWLKIRQIKFTTVVPSAKQDVLENGKKQADGFLKVFIEQIEEYSKIANEKADKRERIYEQKYFELETEMKIILGNYKESIGILENYSAELEQQDIEITNLKKNTVQLSDITLAKLFRMLGNLPLAQLITLIGIVISILVSAAWFGVQLEKSTSKDAEFENKTSIEKLRSEKLLLQDSIRGIEKDRRQLKSEVYRLTEIDSLSKIVNKKK
ncbi:hypothetical protein LPB03_02625 [Polaribacter vadi]|uniref:Uncharacterized protein n=1 Tax=Polaribacter vadi TaxID=1774273 RepID=A0A1B8U202_9FLAO|nr:hypothetical protein [Polaribacter vadi]AOW16429.1 hypothetical protein LPB03_02625 [Polaribacter vadi]OBY65872.1 hypothetical protein LPB3_02455 [Polaribacter vadi]